MNNYILIIANIPKRKYIKDGMILRELAIDKIFDHFDKIYVEHIDYKPSFFKQPKKWFIKHFYNKIKGSKYLTNNPIIYNNISKSNFHILCQNAKKIYVHSLHMLERIPKEYIEEFKDKIILDIHGCVVEELMFENADKNFIKKFKDIEEFAFPIINTLVSVNTNMIDFYKEKYTGIKTNFIHLPIFNSDIKNFAKNNNKNKLTLIYSGGTQSWQKIDLLIDTIKKIADKYEIIILSPEIEKFTKLLGELKQKVVLKSVLPENLDIEYQKADLGFILRDDIIVNRVACPTKIIDYLEYGIIPIISCPEIGDFNKMGYSYIHYEKLIEGKIFDNNELEKMRKNNTKIIERLRNIQQDGKEKLLKLLEN